MELFELKYFVWKLVSEPTPRPYVYLSKFKLIDYDKLFYSVRKRHANTGVWLANNPDFLKWKYESGSDLFWLHGYPGLGKSVIARSTVEMFRQNYARSQSKQRPNPLVCHFFCSDTDQEAKSPINLLASIIHQLLYEDPHLARTLKTKYTNITDRERSSIWSLWEVLSLIFIDLDDHPLFIVIDALDQLEKSCWGSFLEVLEMILQSPNKNIKVFITSRTEPDFQKKMAQLGATCLTIEDSKGVQDDLELYIQESVHEYASENFTFGIDKTQEIVEVIVTRADGMFLWASLAWEQFKFGVGLWNTRLLSEKIQELKQLSAGMERLYHCLLESVAESSQRELLQLLTWIVAAHHPLSCTEMEIALSLVEMPRKAKDMNIGGSIEGFVKRTCPHLIRIDRNGYLTVVHQSFKDFLLGVRYTHSDQVNKFFIDEDQANLQLARDCMVYMGLEDISEGDEMTRNSIPCLKELLNCIGDSELERYSPRNSKLAANLFQRYTFLDYASASWVYHVEGRDDDSQFFQLFQRVISQEYNYKVLCFLKGGTEMVNDLPLFIAAREDLFGLMYNLVEAGHDINALNKNSHIFHVWGIWWDFDRLSILFDLGADVNGHDHFGQTLLASEVRAGWIENVRELLKIPEIDVNVSFQRGMAPLHAAVMHETPVAHEMLEILESRPELDFNREDAYGCTPLTIAIHWGKISIVKALLKNPKVDISKARMYGETPLINAACQGWTDVVLFIMRNTHNFDEFCDMTGRNILHWAVIMGMIDVLELALVGRCQILSNVDNRGMSALHYAAHEGQYRAVELLLHRGAVFNGKTVIGETVLHLAAARGHSRIVKKLLECTPSLSVLYEKDNMGWTSTHRAVVSGNDELVRFLVSLETAHLTKVDRHGRAPIAFAAAHGSLKALEALLNVRGEDIDSVDAFGNTLLHLAAKGNNESTLPFLLKRLSQKGNHPNKWGKTVLDLLPSSSTLREQLVMTGLQHSKGFYNRSVQSFYLRDQGNNPPVHLDWVIAKSEMTGKNTI